MTDGRIGLILDIASPNSSSVVMNLSDRAFAAMQVPQPQDWQRHGCCSEGNCRVTAGSLQKSDTATGPACERAHRYSMQLESAHGLAVRLWELFTTTPRPPDKSHVVSDGMQHSMWWNLLINPPNFSEAIQRPTEANIGTGTIHLRGAVGPSEIPLGDASSGCHSGQEATEHGHNTVLVLGPPPTTPRLTDTDSLTDTTVARTRLAYAKHHGTAGAANRTAPAAASLRAAFETGKGTSAPPRAKRSLDRWVASCAVRGVAQDEAAGGGGDLQCRSCLGTVLWA
ncbi:hypothetical protein V492_05374 [Pseudogymnoascus sp. VKM F-4246]|nr:hypothetical protein V492_05374 [Pseudogymnoascus sp. VKM F-4246]